jgi:hypothetical protein
MNRLVRLLIRDLKGSVGLSWHLLASQLVMPIVYIFIMGLTFANIIRGVTIGGARVSLCNTLR